MRTAKDILYSKAQEKGDGFLSGQVGWIVNAMQEYAEIEVTKAIFAFEEELEGYKGRIRDLEDELRDVNAQLKQS